MHICFLTHEYPKPGFPHGGVGTFIRILGKRLASVGIKVSVVGVNYIGIDEHEKDGRVDIYRLAKNNKIKGLSWLLNSKAINKKLKEINLDNPIDIIESTELGLAFIKKNKRTKYIIRLHGGHHFFATSEKRGINLWKGFQEKLSFKKADKIIGVSEYVLEHTANYLDFFSKRGPCIYNPANLNNFYKADPSKIIQGRLLFVGTVCEKKGIRQLIQALPIIKASIPNVHLVIAGRDWKFPKSGNSYKEYLQKFITPVVRENIEFLGQISNEKIPELIEQAEICVYPSHMEAMPLAWIEVLSMGKAFVGSKLGPGPEVVKDDKTGLLCDPFNPRDIADKVVYLLKNPLNAQELGNNARKDIHERFSIEKLLKQNIEFYNSLLN